MNKKITPDDVNKYNGMLDQLRQNSSLTPEQSQWIGQEKQSIRAAQLFITLPVNDKWQFQASRETYRAGSPTYRGDGGDPAVIKANGAMYDALGNMWNAYQTEFQTGKDINQQTMSPSQRRAAWGKVNLAPKELDDWTQQFSDANAAQGNQADNLIGAYDKFAAEFKDPQLIATGLKQLAGNKDLRLSDQRLIALQIPGSPLLRHTMVQVAGQNINDITKGWDPKAKDVSGKAKDPAAFTRAVYQSTGLAGLRNNPVLGRFPEQVGEIQELVGKVAATYVNGPAGGMSQDAAIKKAEQDVLHGQAVGTIWVDKAYNPNKIKDNMSVITNGATTSGDYTNPLRAAVLGYNMPPKTSIQPLGVSPKAEQKFGGFIDQQADKYHVPRQLLRNLLTHESGWNPNATSGANTNGTRDHGIAQINDSVLAGHPGLNAYDPHQSITYAASRLGDAINHYHGDLRKAVASYNAGIGGVDKNGGPLPGKNTAYVNRILGSTQFQSMMTPTLSRQQAIVGEQQLANFRRAPQWITDPSAPGHSVMVGYNRDGQFHALIDPSGAAVRVPISAMLNYKPKGVQLYAAHEGFSRATGGF